MRSQILSERDRERLENWLRTGEEDQLLRNVFTEIRRDFPRLRDDMLLIIKVIKKLKAEDRWRRRMTRTEFTSISQRDGYESTR